MGETIPFANGYTALTWREPHGVTAHIVPWNYPMQIIGRSVGAALVMGMPRAPSWPKRPA